MKAVTFDLWETLLFERDGSSSERTAIRCRSLAQALSGFGLEVSVEQVQAALKQTTSSLVKVWDKNRDVSHLEQVQLFVRLLSRGKLVVKEEWFAEISRAFVLPLFRVPPYLNPDAREVLEWLRHWRKRIGIICNTGFTPGSDLRRFLSEAGVAEYFHAMVFSDEVSIRKPDRRIFRLAAQALGSEPEETVHVGDNLKVDSWGAKNAGFRAIYLSGNAGRDRMAESDPTSLVFLSRNLGCSRLRPVDPDKTISSLSMVKEAIKEME
jgi:putative hydrolase of the HAD superfamily